MKDFPIILGDGLEIHQIQELVGSDNEYFNAYELRLNLGEGVIKTLKRGIPGVIRCLGLLGKPVDQGTREYLGNIVMKFDEESRNSH